MFCIAIGHCKSLCGLITGFVFAKLVEAYSSLFLKLGPLLMYETVEGMCETMAGFLKKPLTPTRVPHM